jgi:hypothetical protein
LWLAAASLRQRMLLGMHSLPFLGHARVKVSCDMSLSHLARLDALKEQWGVESRAEALHRLLDVCFSSDVCLE